MSYALVAASLLIISAVSVWMIWLSFRDARTRDRSWEKKEQVWTQERQQLLDRIMYLSDRPWEMPGSDQPETEPPPETSYDPLMQPILGEDFDYHANPAGVV